MASVPVVSAAQLQRIAELEADILARAGRPQAQPSRQPDFERRRFDLLSQHLGFTPKQPLPCLHVIGDSHVAFFSGVEGLRFYPGRRVWTGFFRLRRISAFTELLPVFRVFHTGASTAWSANAPRSASQTREKVDTLLRKDIPARGAVMLVFGEIDCRWHIPKNVLAGRDTSTVVNETVTRFMSLPRRLAQAGYDVTVWQPSGVTVGEPTPPETRHPLPIVGPQRLRLEVTRVYAEQLAAACQRENIRCAGIVGKYHSWQEPASPECFLDNCHLSQRLMPLALHALMDSGALLLQRDPQGVCHLAR